jgi:ferric-dicitrate binding protein FerR (iron transport regulator)
VSPDNNNGEWGKAETLRMLEKARQREIGPSPSARARVWAEIERKRVPSLVRPWKLTAVFALGAACLALGVGAFVFLRPLSESALVIAADGAERSVKAGQKLPRLADLALVDMHAAGRMVAGADTQASLERLGPDGIEMQLTRGSLLMHVTPRPQRAPFVVKTPKFTARVVGTVLRVQVHADGRSSLAVGHGAVEVTPKNGKTVIVHTGEHWPADSIDAPAASELQRLGADDLEGVTASAFIPPPAAPAPAPPSTLREESALYEAGFRALHEQEDPRSALAIWTQERTRFPSGTLRKEVDASIIDALVALKQNGRARAEIDSYLRRDPDGMRSAELRFVRATLYRELDRSCRRALPELDRALEKPAEPWAVRARAARAACVAESPKHKKKR